MGDSFTGWSGYGPGADQNVTIGPDSLNYEGAIYEDSLFSDIPIVGPIIDWIEAQLTVLYNWLLSTFTWAIGQISSAVNAVLGVVLAPLFSVVNWIKDKVLDVWHWVTTSIPAAIEWLKLKVLDVWSWVTSAIPTALNWLKQKLSETWSFITTTISGALTWLKQRIGDTWTFITTTVNGALTWLTQKLSDVWTWITTELPRTFEWIGKQFVNIITTLTAVFSDVIVWIEKNVADPVLDGIKGFVDKFFKFVDWIPNMLSNIGGWLMEEQPTAHSPRAKNIFNAIVEWITEHIFDPRKIGDWILAGTGPASLLLFKGLGELFNLIFNDFMHAFVDFVKTMGPQKPEESMINFTNIAQIGRTALMGLLGLTAGGELVKFFGHLGLGHIAAMIYDMTNYKEITGGMMKAFSTAAINLPATHYFNELLRPRLPSGRDVADMFNREIITAEQYSKLLAYEGIPDYWHEPLRRITETPVRYFTLAAIAKAGFYDQVFFEAQLVRGGYDPDTRTALMRMFQGTYSEVIKGLMSGTAIKRYKEGMSTESQFQNELKLLGYTDQQFPQYLAAAKLDYAYDYQTDMIAAYKDAAGKGQISLDDFRGALRGLGIVPARIEAYVLRIRARLDPAGPLKPIGPPKPEYQTEAGQVKADTLRRHRQKEMITRDEEIAGLQKLGAPIDYATAIADNDDARLAAAAVTEIGPPKPFYETDAGKIQVDTLRRERRKDIISRDEEIAGLMELEMTELYATAIADNDDARLAEKGSSD
jgi:hypothetical protein